MKDKIKNYIKVATYTCGLIIFLLLGTQIERLYQQELLKQKETVERIAIVNMDEGTWVEGEHVNYASELLYLPADNFEITGLTEAKSGIENGLYAAYIVLPENFSEMILSIINNPQKIAIEYQFNTNLSEQAEIKAINHVYNFIFTLNSNISFIYLDAILTEFHNVQDQSNTILSNDVAELEQLTGVDASDLIVSAEPIEEVVVTNNTQTIDLQPYYDNNVTYLSSMETAYDDAMTLANEDFGEIQTANTEISTAIDDFFVDYDAYIADIDEDQKEKLSEGKTLLCEKIGLYNDAVVQSDFTQDIKRLMSIQRTIDEDEANRQLEIILDNLGIDSTAYSIDLGETIDSEESIDIEQEITDFNQKIKDTYTLESEQEEIEKVVQENLVDVLLGYSDGQKELLETARDNLLEKMTTYETLILDFDLMSYIEDANLGQYLTSIQTNTNSMFYLVQSNNQEYISYANEICIATATNNQNLISALNDANTQTVSNVEECIGELAESRTSVNAQNVAILQNFTELLPYTRVDSVENTETYDYIISPVSSQRMGVSEFHTYFKDTSEKVYLKEIIYLIIVVALLIGSVQGLNVLWNRKQKAEVEL